MNDLVFPIFQSLSMLSFGSLMKTDIHLDSTSIELMILIKEAQNSNHFQKALPAQPAKLDLNKKSLTKQNNFQNFTIDAQGFRKTKNVNPPTQEMEVTS